jgi:hypothetical protein
VQNLPVVRARCPMRTRWNVRVLGKSDVRVLHCRDGATSMNEKQLVLIQALQERLNIMLDAYDADPMYAPPAWTLENFWHTLEAIKKLTGTES